MQKGNETSCVLGPVSVIQDRGSGCLWTGGLLRAMTLFLLVDFTFMLMSQGPPNMPSKRRFDQ